MRLERIIRQVATECADDEAFIIGLEHEGLNVLERGHPIDGSRIGYAVRLSGRRWYAGHSLARDLTLPRLIDAWTQAFGSFEASPTGYDRAAVQAFVAQAPEQRARMPWPWAHATHGFHRLPCPAELSGARRLLYERQRGMCALCAMRAYDDVEVHGADAPLRIGCCEHLDHDHATGLVRGLLCRRCNTAKEPRPDAFSDAYREYAPAQGLAELHERP